MNISLRQLTAFLGVASSCSFTKTAQRLHLSQAALSAIIRELESQLQCRLLNRTTRTVSLTEAGKAFLPVATQVINAIEGSALELGKMGREEQRVLRVGVTPHIAVSLMPAVLRQYALLAPSVNVQVTDSAPGDLLQMVEAGDLDVAYGAFFVKASGVDRVPIFPTCLVVVSPLDELAAWSDFEKSDVTWHCLKDVPLIALPKDNPIQRLIEENLAREMVQTGKRTEVGHLETAIAMAEAGFGVAIVPSLSEAICQRFRVRLSVIRPIVELSFYCITKAGRGNIEGVGVFSEAFTEIASNAQGSSLRKVKGVKRSTRSQLIAE
jgi:DNA-binding transcriptional LysR family regulator